MVYSMVPAKVNHMKKLIKDVLGEKNVERVRKLVNNNL